MTLTWYIQIQGQVQGVGFRPFVWRVATERHFTGWVANGMGGVEIMFNATKSEAHNFKNFILKNAPTGSLITTCSLEIAPKNHFEGFVIKNSTTNKIPTLLISPDVAICPDCRKDLFTPGNRREKYPFTTCTLCGPRFSIIESLPYDRIHTTMRDFSMCPDCLKEYNQPEERRFFAQTLSCPACAITINLTTPAGDVLSENSSEITEKTIQAWHSGSIVAVKGIGGYLLTCDAANAQAISRLRLRKKRPDKPLALMYPDVSMLKKDVFSTKKMRNALCTSVAPIILFRLKKNPGSGIVPCEIAPGLDSVGIMLSYAPLFVLLLKEFGKPIVATSANFSETPIIFCEEELPKLSGVAELFLTHNRRIFVPQDDSVVAFDRTGMPVWLRRARGLAPGIKGMPRINSESSPEDLVAVGADMKATFCMRYRGNFFLSQYLGNLSDFDTRQRYEWLLRHSLRQLSVRPAVILGDLHPGYVSTGLGKHLADELGVHFIQYQHHEAHFTAVLAENHLLQSTTPVLGVIWDGTGYGHDGQIWGSEFFSYQKGLPIQHLGHLPAMPVLLGDKMAREPRLSALAFCKTFAPEITHYLSEKFTPTEWDLYQKIINAPSKVSTSGMGRIFDAVASLLSLADKISHEGRAAMLLEAAARRFLRKNPAICRGYYSRGEKPQHPLSLDWMAHLATDVKKGAPPEQVAASFHLSLVEMIADMAERGGFSAVAFSGGVFQNILLVDLLKTHFASRKVRLFFHRELPPNDENIPFGQVWRWLITR